MINIIKLLFGCQHEWSNVVTHSISVEGGKQARYKAKSDNTLQCTKCDKTKDIIDGTLCKDYKELWEAQGK